METMKDSERNVLMKFLNTIVGKLTLLVTIVTSISLLVPVARDFIIGDEIENNTEEIYEYIDKQIEQKDSVAKDWLFHFKMEISRIDERYEMDSLDEIKGEMYHAIGLRADDNGALIYRDRYGNQYPVRADTEQQRYMYRVPDGTWYWCYFEEL